MAVLNRFAGARAPANFYSSMFNYYALWKAFSSSSLSSEVDLKSTLLSRSSSSRPDLPMDRNVQWVFLGCPGVGKGTYASRLSSLLGVPHIATGDLVREELSSSGPLASQEILEGVTDIDLVVNLKLREEALLAKCLGRRICSECGGNYNITCIDIKDKEGRPELYMAPLLPPPNCASKLITRSDDTEAVVKERLRIYKETSQPVEDFYRKRGKLLEFDLPGGIPESWPKLLQALNLEDLNHKQSAAA
ncbi:probable adenylate kinase 6, chloroplastic isoform X2 [Cucumis sativus]|uniref:probable adenylate kinase 6, chloroplastic isoform X2 n=1 Tax=Cucumis sativus TaxID=3659 RepID=UPI0012F4A111|nr:probable adenylate kinase 6, chloroplastic isoform X2 [Cucumis sativus]